MKKQNKREEMVPDDPFVADPFQYARFGEYIGFRLNENTIEFQARLARMAARFPQMIAEINARVSRIATLIARHHPEQLLLRAWWKYFSVSTTFDEGDRGDDVKTAAGRMIEYIQSVIAGVQPAVPYCEELTDKEWTTLTEEFHSLFHSLTNDYQFYLIAHNRANDPNYDHNLDEFRYLAEVYWINVRGKRYEVHQKQAFLDVLKPHSHVLFRLFGIDSETLVNGIGKIHSNLATGHYQAMIELERLRNETLDKVKNLSETTGITDLATLRKRAFEDSDLAGRAYQISGRLFAFDVFDVTRVSELPCGLLNELTWSPGEDKEFFAPGDLGGWPLRIWPTMKRPFIRLNGRVLCFHLHSLFDNFYRVLQRAIFRIKPDYRETWNIRQKNISEQLPFTYLERLLPGAVVHRTVRYQWDAGSGKKQWYETDGLLIYEDHLFVIEVKAGAFTRTSPSTDLPGHINSLKGLLAHPALQGNRFVDYLESEGEVPIYDANYVKTVHLRRCHFRRITLCAFTLDAFTELAARSQHLKRINVYVGQRPIWVLSIDDLRGYADLFDNPILFLHYVEQRIRAANSDLVELDDEFEHLGLYFSHNNYSQYPDEVLGDKSDEAYLHFSGFRKPFDDYFGAVARGETCRVPSQEMPPRLEEIMSFLGSSVLRGRAELATLLLDRSDESRSGINSAIDQQLDEHPQLGRARPISIYGGLSLTLCIWSPLCPRQAKLALHHTRKVIAAANGEEGRVLIELEYSKRGRLEDVHWQRVSLSGLSGRELERIRAEGVSLRKRRLAYSKRTAKDWPERTLPLWQWEEV